MCNRTKTKQETRKWETKQGNHSIKSKWRKNSVYMHVRRVRRHPMVIDQLLKRRRRSADSGRGQLLGADGGPAAANEGYHRRRRAVLLPNPSPQPPTRDYSSSYARIEWEQVEVALAVVFIGRKSRSIFCFIPHII